MGEQGRAAGSGRVAQPDLVEVPRSSGTASLVGVLVADPAAAAYFATRDEAFAMMKRAVVFIEERGETDADVEFSNKGGGLTTATATISVLGLDGQVLDHSQRDEQIGRGLIDAKIRMENFSSKSEAIYL